MLSGRTLCSLACDLWSGVDHNHLSPLLLPIDSLPVESLMELGAAHQQRWRGQAVMWVSWEEGWTGFVGWGGVRGQGEGVG